MVFSDSTCERDHTVLAVLCLTYLTSHDVPKGQSRCHLWQDRSQRLKGQPRQPPVLTPAQAHAPAWPVTAWAPLGPRAIQQQRGRHRDVHDRAPLPARRWQEVCPAGEARGAQSLGRPCPALCPHRAQLAPTHTLLTRHKPVAESGDGQTPETRSQPFPTLRLKPRLDARAQAGGWHRNPHPQATGPARALQIR